MPSGDRNSAAIPRQEVCRGTRPKPKPTVARCHRRSENLFVAFRMVANDGPEAIIASVTPAELQQTMAEREPGVRIIRPQHQVTPKISGGDLVLADLLMCLADPEQRL